MGYSYADWLGVFYPPGMRSENFLTYYSRIFNAVEIDSSFYGLPSTHTLQRWVASTPREFRFCLKMPRAITHNGVLLGVQTEMRQFVHRVQGLGDKLGVILLQFPPSFTVENVGALESLLMGLPPGVCYAVEVRHPSWYTSAKPGEEPMLAGLLREHGVCWTANDYPGLPRVIYRTVDFLYVRWIGQHGSFSRHDRERVDRTATLREWYDLLIREVGEVRSIYGFFNNDFAGFAAGTANRFKQLAGFEVHSFDLPQQGRLF